MFALRDPRPDDLNRLLAVHERRQLSYSQVGWSLDARAPKGAFVNQCRCRLGEGATEYEQARKALRMWRMFPGGWLRAYTHDPQVAPGNVVATVARCAGLWVVNTCRVVYVQDELSEWECFAIGYGTLAGHLMRGEERFRVSWDHRDNSVWYDVWSFSWPQRWIARCALPLIRGLQRRFAAESPAAMQAAIAEEIPS
jgi:uncharacterized protein (UPF0548 family)